MAEKLTPEELDQIKRTDYGRFLDIVNKRGERKAESPNRIIAGIGRETQRLVRELQDRRQQFK